MTLTAAELYGLLGEVGTRAKSIEPFALEAYPALFECPQVVFRLRGDRSTAALAEAASKALTHAITTLPAKTDQLIAEAILGAGPFQGVTVGERLATLGDQKYGCSVNSYKKNRKRVLDDIVRYLLSGEPPQPMPQAFDGELGFTVDDSPVGLLGRAADAAVNLMYACLATLFAHDFLCAGDPEERALYHGRYTWDGLGAYLFDAYSVFHTNLAMVASPDPEARTQLLSHVTQSFLDRLSVSLQQAAAVDPFVESKNAYDEEIFAKYGSGDFVDYPSAHYRLLGAYATMLTRGGTRGRYKKVNDMYESVWVPWYVAQVGIGIPWVLKIIPTGQPKGIEEMADIGRVTYDTIEEHVNFERPLRAYARRRAIKVIAYYYAPDEWLPVIGGQSLRDHIDRFFDEKIGLRARG